MPPKSITLCLMNSISWISYMVLAISALLPYENVDVIPVPLFFRDLLALLSYIFRLQPVGCFTSQLIYTSTSQGLKDFLGKLVWLPWFQRQQQSSTLQLSGYHEDQTMICRWPGFNSLPFHYVAKKKKSLKRHCGSYKELNGISAFFMLVGFLFFQFLYIMKFRPIPVYFGRSGLFRVISAGINFGFLFPF